MAKARIFNIMQYVNHPQSGEPLLSEETIKAALAHKTVTRWAYILHDEDVYSAKDEEDDPTHTQGETKPPHWHIVLETARNNLDVLMIAKWFRIPENFIDIAKGAGAFLDCCKYLTHEDIKQQMIGKRLYTDDKVKANFPFREELSKRAERQIKYGRDLSEKDALRNDVLYRGVTLLKIVDQYPIAYQNDMKFLQQCRIEYLKRFAPMPKVRINYYLEGPGGIGKNLASRALARALYPDLTDEECYFEIGGNRVSFDGYDGQPVIVWNDQRAQSLLSQWSRGEVFDMFDTYPTTSMHNVKYSAVRLVNEINIVNGVQPYSEFLDGLTGMYKDVLAEDPSQSRRRFPIILCLREDDFDVLINSGVAQGTREYDQYFGYKDIQGSFKRIAQRLGGDARQIAERKVLAPVVKANTLVKTQLGDTDKIVDVELPEEFADYGTMRHDPELPGMPQHPADPLGLFD